MTYGPGGPRSYFYEPLDIDLDRTTDDQLDAYAQREENGHRAPPQEEPLEPLPFTSVASWHGTPIPERRWTVLNRVPAANVTLMSGDGGVGKTILALHLCAAVALGRDWLGSMPECGPAMAFCCEDDDGELHRRVALVADHYGVSLAEMPDFHWCSMAGDEALLATPNKNGIIQPTKLFTRLREAALDIKPKFIVLDNSADIFGGSENDRAQVRQFITILRGLAMAANAGVLLTSHPSLTGISSGSGLSGSTGWNNNVRSRMYFRKVTTEKDEEPDPDVRNPGDHEGQLRPRRRNRRAPLAERPVPAGRRHRHTRQAGRRPGSRQPVPRTPRPLHAAGPQRLRPADRQHVRANPVLDRPREEGKAPGLGGRHGPAIRRQQDQGRALRPTVPTGLEDRAVLKCVPHQEGPSLLAF